MNKKDEAQYMLSKLHPKYLKLLTEQMDKEIEEAKRQGRPVNLQFRIPRELVENKDGSFIIDRPLASDPLPSVAAIITTVTATNEKETTTSKCVQIIKTTESIGEKK